MPSKVAESYELTRLTMDLTFASSMALFLSGSQCTSPCAARGRKICWPVVKRAKLGRTYQDSQFSWTAERLALGPHCGLGAILHLTRMLQKATLLFAVKAATRSWISSLQTGAHGQTKRRSASAMMLSLGRRKWHCESRSESLGCVMCRLLSALIWSRRGT